jgi:hypothetical protein
MYYDRSGNQNSKTKRDWANALKNAIAFENEFYRMDGKFNVPNHYLPRRSVCFAKAMMEKRPGLVKLKIDKLQ